MHLHTGRAASQLNHALSTMVPRDGRGSSEFWNQVGRLQFVASLFDYLAKTCANGSDSHGMYMSWTCNNMLFGYSSVLFTALSFMGCFGAKTQKPTKCFGSASETQGKIVLNKHK